MASDILILMISALLLAYQMPMGAVSDHDLRVTFEGMIPILGGNEGKADVRLGVRIEAQKAADGRMAATTELTRAELFFNDAKLPLTLENVQDFFPKSKVEFDARGKILKNDAPQVDIPVRLPGLDVQRFPDITFLPLELPEKPVRVGTTWSFEKSFAGSPVTYQCTVTKIDGATATISVKIEQTYTVFEDAAMQVLEEKNDAENEVTTKLTASGEVEFRTDTGRVVRSLMSGQAVSEVRSLADGKVTPRQLKMRVEFQPAKQQSDATPTFLKS